MGSRSASKVPVKRGNGRGTPWREEGHQGTEPLEGKADRTPLRDTVSTQLRRIASCGEPVTLRSRMRQRARPDLWEAWVGDHPGPPGMHWGQVRTLRNLYRKTRGEPARFFPDNPTFPT